MLRIPRPRSNFGSQTSIRNSNFSSLETNRRSYDNFFSSNSFETFYPSSDYISEEEKEYRKFSRSISEVNSLSKSLLSVSDSECSTPVAKIGDVGGSSIIGEDLVIPGPFGPRKCEHKLRNLSKYLHKLKYVNLNRRLSRPDRVKPRRRRNRGFFAC